MTPMQKANVVRSKSDSKKRLTPWIDGARLPAREGVYRRRSAQGAYACWDGTAWYLDAPSPHAAAAQLERSALQQAAWRGLSTPPDAPCFACRGHTVIDRGVDAETGHDLIDECPEC